MKRILLAMAACAACGPSQPRTNDAVAVAPNAVVAKPLEVVGEGSGASDADVARFELAIGGSQFCARIEGKVHCGRADDTANDPPLAAVPPLAGIDDATSLALAPDFGCVTTRRGTVHCWGSNMSGQLGAKLREDHSKDPVQVVGLANAKRVFVGEDHACATTTDGALFCWGLNGSGETGGTTSWAQAARELVTATVVPNVREVVSVAMTYRSTCAVAKKGDVWCWGSSITAEQQKAQGHVNERPFQLSASTKAEDLSASSGAFCGVRAGEVLCFGSTYSLVPGGGGPERDTPAKVENLSGITKVRVGGYHACALTRDGRVSCWGYNASGELGRGEQPDQSYAPKEAAPVVGIVNARDIVVGRNMSCAVLAGEEVQCWGMWPGSIGATPRSERSPVRLRVR